MALVFLPMDVVRDNLGFGNVFMGTVATRASDLRAIIPARF